jgi:hypothetical protein
MKIIIIFTIVIMSACLTMSIGSIAWSEDNSDSQDYDQLRPTRAIKYCVEGWKPKPGTKILNDNYTCVPSVPIFTCPENSKPMKGACEYGCTPKLRLDSRNEKKQRVNIF